MAFAGLGRLPTRPSSKGRVASYIAGGVLLVLALVFGYELVTLQQGKGGGSSSRVALLRTCPEQPNATLQRLYANEPALSVDVFTFEHDAVSKEVQDHAQREFHLGHRMVHQFYAKTLCAASATRFKSCQGLVLDVGAFIGTHALLLARLGFTVHAFEPQTHAVDLIRCSAAASGLKLTAVAQGVSDVTGKECFLNPMVSAMHQAMTAPKLLTKMGCDESAQVPVVTLDQYWEQVLNKEQVLFLKIDVEGHEAYVMRGAAKMLAAAPPPFILMEYYPHMLTLKNETPSALVAGVYDYGYRVYDCTKKVEVPAGAKGETILKPYASSFGLTDLLLIHKSHAPQDKSIDGQYKCAY